MADDLGLEVHMSHNKALSQRRSLEERHAAVGQGPDQHPLACFKRVFGAVVPLGFSPVVRDRHRITEIGLPLSTPPRRSDVVSGVVAAIERAAERHRREGLPGPEVVTPEQRREAAAIYRQHAAELERGT